MAKTEKLSNVKQHTVYKDTEGIRLPGATTVIGILNKPQLVAWANRLGLEGIDSSKYVNKLALIGTLAHYRIECELRNVEPDLDAYSKEEIDKSDNALLSWWAWREKHDIVPKLIEVPLVSERHRFGGTVDFYGEVDGLSTLVDFKTSSGIFPEHILQVAAYSRLLDELGYPVNGIRILQIGRDETEGFSEHLYAPEDLDKHWRIFVLCREIYELQKEVKKGVRLRS